MPETIDVLEAARRLGVTPDAVRARLRRGTLEGYRDNSGNWRIVSTDTTADTTRDTTPESHRHDTDTTRHDVVSPDLARLLKSLVERIEADRARLDADQARLLDENARLIEERDRFQDLLQEARADADHAKADQVRMARDVTMMFDELKALADRHAELHADRARLQTELEQERRRWWHRWLWIKR